MYGAFPHYEMDCALLGAPGQLFTPRRTFDPARIPHNAAGPAGTRPGGQRTLPPPSASAGRGVGDISASETEACSTLARPPPRTADAINARYGSLQDLRVDLPESPEWVGNRLSLSAEKQTFLVCLNVVFPVCRQCLFLAHCCRPVTHEGELTVSAALLLRLKIQPALLATVG